MRMKTSNLRCKQSRRLPASPSTKLTDFLDAYGIMVMLFDRPHVALISLSLINIIVKE